MVSGTLSTGLTAENVHEDENASRPVSMQGLEVLALPVASLPDRIASYGESNPFLKSITKTIYSATMPFRASRHSKRRRSVPKRRRTTLRVGRLLAIRLESRAQPSGTFLVSRMIA